jgi:hypothetical protein
MHRFRVLANGDVIGTTNLEFGDPPMGVAFGVFFPNERYAPFRDATPLLETGVRAVSLQAPDDTIVPAQVGAYIRDVEVEPGERELEVEALGIPYPQYDDLFPEHVRAYKAMFREFGAK